MKTQKVIVVATHRSGRLELVAVFDAEDKKVAQGYAENLDSQRYTDQANILLWNAERIIK